MAFKGYWFNNMKQKYLTFKYPHCYVGIINQMGEGASWGNFIDKLVHNKSTTFGNYSKQGIEASFGKYNNSTISVSFGTEYILTEE